MKSKADLPRWLDIARELLECPTAPLMEECPARFILKFAAHRPSLALKRDAAGNIYLGYPRNVLTRKDPLVLVAHLDHPGFQITEASARDARLKFRGGVGLSHAVPGTGVRFFGRGDSKSTGRGRLISAAGSLDRLQTARAHIDTGRAELGGYAMWDLPAYSLRGGRIITRCCDDLLGAAAALCVLDDLDRRKPRDAKVWALFTRAEEVGFYGALMAVKHRAIPKAARVISLECSRALPHAPQGAGVIVRVGDRASLFDATLTEALRQACEQLRRTDASFRYQRRLMDGGTCEATAFCSAGYRASGLALPLGNYHNQAFARKEPRIGPEHVVVADFEAEVRLLIKLAECGRKISKLEKATARMLAERALKANRELRAMPLLV